ncbi:two-component system, OmpR family, response regulator [Duganella sp. CF402]|uniref:response regulator n=1 Tax=unclassified Duganella TaxID=2636909 RepID=UPI0008C5852E|nr:MULTISPECIES: response regulator transcription factor [unclassified Duganella]RZT10287.1 winged helix family two component transcriptional regulator [Duganella sp. BK701]SEL20244.1 two-component system, OmpR family, response regulator [Duganella sp. CF402]
MRLLLVEDDPMIGESIEEGLRGESYAVDWVRTGGDVELALAGVAYDLMLLDLGLPGKQGMEVLRAARARGDDFPVLIITARDGTPARVEGLDAGADDYLVKPFDLDELLARIRALLRRRVSRTQSVIVHGNLRLDLASHEATLDGQPVKLSAREFSVLRVLLDNPGSVVSKAQLEEKLYGWNAEVESNTVDVYVHHLRKKFGSDFIKNVRGVGYKIAAAP